MVVPPQPPWPSARGPVMTSAKRTLRATMRKVRADFATGRPPIPVPPELTEHLQQARMVASYWPLGGEADPAGVASACAAHGLALCLPWVASKAAAMRFLAWAPRDPLYNGPFGLRQPQADAPPSTPDVILTPLLAFDQRGNRLGQGAGHYDRAFADHPRALRIGIAWSVQEVSDLPVDPWDVPLHAIITERGWTKPETKR